MADKIDNNNSNTKKFKEISWDADKWTPKITPKMTFPISTKKRIRNLIIRNCSKIDLYFKLLTDSSDLTFEYEYGDLPGLTYVVINVTCRPGTIAPSNVGNIHVLIKPKNTHVSYNATEWLTGNSYKVSELAHVINVIRTKEFASKDTVIEMPGNATFVTSVPIATEGIDDNDTITAINIDRDVMTACTFSMTDINESLPSETILSTCKNIASDTATGKSIISDTNTARDIMKKNWLQKVLDYLFPLPDTFKIPSSKDSFTEMFPCGTNTITVNNKN